MVLKPSSALKSLYIIHLASYRNPNISTDSADEPFFVTFFFMVRLRHVWMITGNFTRTTMPGFLTT